MPHDQPTPSLAADTIVENYRVQDEIGHGGTGTVYSALHVATLQRVAIKVLHPEHRASAEAVARFRRDAKLVAQLRGEHICRITSFGSLPTGEPYMILELLDGDDLQTISDRSGRLDVVTVVDYVLQACIALAEAHGRGVVHRDIKPANLFRLQRRDGSELIKVLDFGIAKSMTGSDELLTRTGSRIGSLPYMSPEQLRSSKSVDTRTDIWSLGATMYQLASGHLPFRCDSSFSDTAIRIWSDEPASLRDVPRDFDEIVMRCLAKDAANRFANVAALATALAPLGGEDSPVLATRVGRTLGASKQT